MHLVFESGPFFSKNYLNTELKVNKYNRRTITKCEEFLKEYKQVKETQNKYYLNI